MTKPEKLAFKTELKLFCKSIIEDRINTAKAAIESAQQSANNEEKSSAGDKYETGRAMSHLDKDMHSRQLAENMKELAVLHSINTSLVYSTAEAGAVIHCADISFFIATGLGKRSVHNQTIFFLSVSAPLSQLLKNKKAGDSFIFNGTTVIISELY